MNQNVFNDYWQEIYDSLPALATRKQIHSVTGGIISVGTLANRDCFGTGIPNKKVINKKVCYPRADIVTWLMQQEEGS